MKAKVGVNNKLLNVLWTIIISVVFLRENAATRSSKPLSTDHGALYSS